MECSGFIANFNIFWLCKCSIWLAICRVMLGVGTKAQSVLADTQTYNTTLESLRNNPAMTENLLAQMRRSRIPPSVVTLGILVASTCTWQKAIELVAEGQEHSIVPNTIVYNALITALEKGSQWPTCLDLLQRLDTNATVVSFNACISACARDQQSRQAQRLGSEAKAANFGRFVDIFLGTICKSDPCLSCLVGWS